MKKSLITCFIVCLFSTLALALPIDKNSTQQNSALSETAQKLIEINMLQNQNNITAEICLKNSANRDFSVSSETCLECNCIGNSSNCITIDIDKKFDVSGSSTASIGDTQPKWLK